MDKIFENFVWDSRKEWVNVQKHGIDFSTAVWVFKDPHRKIYMDTAHSREEDRYYCIGNVHGKVMTVRFAYRVGKIRIFGAGYWRKGRKFYEERP